MCSLEITPSNNHGCSGFSLIVEPITATTGKVVGGESCPSCWQVGHDSNEPIRPIGTIVQLPTNITWEEATEQVEISQSDISLESQTRVTPYDVTVIAQKCDDCGKITPSHMLYAVYGGKNWCVDCWPDALIVCPVCGAKQAKQYDCAPTTCYNCGFAIKG